MANENIRKQVIAKAMELDKKKADSARDITVAKLLQDFEEELKSCIYHLRAFSYLSYDKSLISGIDNFFDICDALGFEVADDGGYYKLVVSDTKDGQEPKVARRMLSDYEAKLNKLRPIREKEASEFCRRYRNCIFDRRTKEYSFNPQKLSFYRPTMGSLLEEEIVYKYFEELGFKCSCNKEPPIMEITRGEFELQLKEYLKIRDSELLYACDRIRDYILLSESWQYRQYDEKLVIIIPNTLSLTCEFALTECDKRFIKEYFWDLGLDLALYTTSEVVVAHK